jgi:hypothetical protein
MINGDSTNMTYDSPKMDLSLRAPRLTEFRA